MSRAQQTSTVEQNTGGAVAPFLAGKNKIINGDFSIWQRGTNVSTPPGFNNYAAADRWHIYNGAGSSTATCSQQAFTAGSAPVAGYEGAYFHRIALSGFTSGNFDFEQRMEDGRLFSGQNVTISFWAKAAATTTVPVYLTLNTGTGGTGGGTLLSFSATVGTSWQRFVFTGAVPSLAGNTIGTGSFISLIIRLISNATLDTWGVQVETGSVVTPFTTASNTLQGELALCQRYYQLNDFYVEGYTLSGGTTGHQTVWRVTPRTTPTITFITSPFTTNLNSYGVIRMTAQGAEHYIVATSTGAAYAFSGVYSVSAEL